MYVHVYGKLTIYDCRSIIVVWVTVTNKLIVITALYRAVWTSYWWEKKARGHSKREGPWAWRYATSSGWQRCRCCKTTEYAA